MAKSSVNGLLGICKRAGRLTVGFNAVKAQITARHVALVMLASDVSPKTEKEIEFLLRQLSTAPSPLHLDMTKTEISATLGSEKPIGVLSTEDTRFAAALLKACRHVKEVDVS